MGKRRDNFTFKWYRALAWAYQPFARFNKHLEIETYLRSINALYDPRPEDIFVVSYPKSGTTWVQEILYQLLSDGDLDRFPHISAWSPHVEEPKHMINPPIGMMPSPRVLKSHLYYKYIPKGPGKYIYIMRDGMDAAYSYYNQHSTHRMYQGTFDEFLPLFFNGTVTYGSWFHHVSDWLKRKNDLDLLYLAYEDLVEDLEGGIRKIAAFCNIPIDEAQFPRILERCTFKYMRENQEKFDLAQEMVLAIGLNFNKFIREGKVGRGRDQFSPEQYAVYRRLFEQHLQGKGLDHYCTPPQGPAQPESRETKPEKQLMGAEG